MSVDTTDLELRVRTLEVKQATTNLKGLEGQAKKTERATDGLTNAFKKLAAPLLAVVSIGKLATDIIAAQRSYDKLSSTLQTLTGSAEKASEVFKVLQNYANVTPFTIQNLNDSFIKLVNYGLDPSEKALTSYGNTAVSLGKDITDMVQAVAAATTGEFDSLKSFGIKAKNMGAEVQFSFQGVNTTVKNTSAAIEGYLMALGENQFAGAMEKNLGKLDDTLAGLSEQYDTLMLNISQLGLGKVFQDSAQLGVDALTELNTMVSSGEMEKYLAANTAAWGGWGDDVKETIDILGRFISESMDTWEKLAGNTGKGMYLGFKEFPVEVRAYFQEAAVEVITFFSNAATEAKYGWDLVKAAVTKDDTFKEVTARYKEQMRQSNEVYDSMMDDISQEKDASLNSINEQIQAGKDLRAEYDKQIEARKKLNEDRLAQYKINAPTDTTQTPAEKKAAEAKEKARQKEFDAVVKSLYTETEAIQAEYEKRKKIIEKNTTAESTTRISLMEKLEKYRQKELDDLYGIEQMYEKRVRLAGEVAAIEESMWTDAEKAANSYQKQIETLWQAQQAGVISAQQHKDMVNGVTAEYEKQQDTQKETFFDLDELSKQAARNSQDAFADFLFDPFSKGLDGMLIGFVKVVQRMAAEAAAAQLAGKLFGSVGGGSGAGWLGSLISIGASFFGGGGGATGAATAGGAAQGASNFGSQFDPSMGNVSFPGRASGGPTVAGQMYEVAENGPELYHRNGRSFLLDGQGGSVTPTGTGAAGTVGGNIQISQTFIIDGQGNVNESGGNPDDQDSTKFANIMKNVAVQAIRDQQSPGGLLWNQTENRNG